MGAFLLPLLGALGAELTGLDIPFIGPLPGFGAGKPRRRRRRMLTASDKVDIAFLRATLGPGAAKELAAVRLANI